MSLQEQTAWDAPPVLRTHRPPPVQQGRTPARKGAGRQAGIHPEDEPYHTTGQPARRPRADVQSVEVYDYPPRMPTVVRKYNQPVTKVTQEVPVRRLLPAHFLLTVIGIFLLVIVLALFLTTYVFPALVRWNDDRVYGYPRTLHMRANVGHGTKEQPDSDFTAENINGYIYVVEIAEVDPAQRNPHIYFVIRYSGQNSNLVAIQSISFSDLNADGKPDMLVVLENGNTFVFYNTGTDFSQQNPVKK